MMFDSKDMLKRKFSTDDAAKIFDEIVDRFVYLNNKGEVDGVDVNQHEVHRVFNFVQGLIVARAPKPGAGPQGNEAEEAGPSRPAKPLEEPRQHLPYDPMCSLYLALGYLRGSARQCTASSKNQTALADDLERAIRRYQVAEL